MKIKFEILEISPRIKYITNNSSEILSILLNSGSSTFKIYDLEKAIKEKKKINLLINQNKMIKLNLIKNNSQIIGTAEFEPSNEKKWINLKEISILPNNENHLIISSEKNKDKLIGIKNYEGNNFDKKTEYYITSAKSNFIPSIHNIKMKISMKINSNSKSKNRVSRKTAKNSPSTLLRGTSQIFFNGADKYQIINNQNICNEMKKKKFKKDNSIKLKKNLKNVKSSSSIKLSLNQYITNNNVSLNSIYTTINSNNKNTLKIEKNNKSLIDRKQKSQYNFKSKKSYIKEEFDNNFMINPTYYNNTITLESNNKKIEDLIIDNNFKDKLKSDEIINLNYLNLGSNQPHQIKNINCENSILNQNPKKNLNKSNPINMEILELIQPFDEQKKNKEEKEDIKDIKAKEKKSNSVFHILNNKYDISLFGGINRINEKDKCIPNLIISDNNDDEYIKAFEIFKNDIIIYYTKEYLNSIKDDVLLLELQLIIEKIFNLKLEYQQQYISLFNNFNNYKILIKLIQEKFINTIKKNNKLYTKKINLKNINNNSDLFDLENKQFLIFEKSLITNNEIDIFNNLINNKSKRYSNLDIKNKNNLINLFLFICKKNIKNLNTLSKRFYLDIKNKKEVENKDLKETYISELNSLVTLQNSKNENIKEEMIRTLTKTSNNNVKKKSFFPGIKTTNREENKKNQKFLFINPKTSEKKKLKKDKFITKFH